ncbi:MAG: (2Fe-2S)-binding protein [Thaumarchaeota archaeon]|jgi:carbon-monoxide dehydrogenase small subunit|nr:(2Fe-2S)-binding protein [Candidatus Geocrenenecus arthurdayi]MCL7390030.1 (2Fe-2S)-binding protein [Candidatus Geocrenenecus arthurdayi]MCL7391908.1 (2Fe-2S)-binding protein [Candidatus Geocrenenecus arthurdayi]MCL7397353.1 (2Fe-2S)-binding protein [Candidatus Geocrenenecus arthurdayi]MCL7402597.1 (2Fe-2S)-binding protein [Candidatus Geocrenenecus arthurdayi]
MRIELIVNGVRRIIDVMPNELLINVLREKLGLTGTKYGCGIGECGACTVMVDGKPVLSCLTLAVEVAGREITTIEGIAKDGQLDPIQEAFIEEGAIQCGYCTPGFIITAKALLNENKSPSREEIIEYIKGNLCRCTGYINIIKAIQKASEKIVKNSASKISSKLSPVR